MKSLKLNKISYHIEWKVIYKKALTRAMTTGDPAYISADESNYLNYFVLRRFLSAITPAGIS